MVSPFTAEPADVGLQTSLDPTETSPPASPPPGSSPNAITAASRGRYLWDLATTDRQAMRALSIEYCRTDATVWTKAGHFTAFPKRCRDRLCPECQKALQHRYTDEIAARVQMYAHPKHVVLTLAHSDQQLRKQVQRIKACFGRLRQTSTWKALAGQGVYSLELKRNPKDRRWHVHLHVLVNARFIPHKWLSSEWHRITRDSSIVWVEAASKRHACYVAKYVGKSYDGHLEPFEEWPFADEMHGLRTCETFGREEKIRNSRHARDADGWTYLGTLSDYKRRANDGEMLACLVMDELVETGALDKLRLNTVTSDW